MSERDAKVLEIIAEVSDVPLADIRNSTSVESLGLDSLDSLEAMMRLEDAFGVELDAVRFSACTSVGDILKEVAAAAPP